MRRKVIGFYVMLFAFVGALAFLHTTQFRMPTGFAVVEGNFEKVVSQDGQFSVFVSKYEVSGNMIKVNYQIDSTYSGIAGVSFGVIQEGRESFGSSQEIVYSSGNNNYISSFYVPAGNFDGILRFSNNDEIIEASIPGLEVKGSLITGNAVSDDSGNSRISKIAFVVVGVVLFFVILLYFAPRRYERKRAVKKMARGIHERHIKLDLD